MWLSKRAACIAATAALLSLAMIPLGAFAKEVGISLGGSGVPPIASPTVGALPRAIAVTRDESYAYIANFNADTLTILDLESFQTVGEIVAGDGPGALTVSPDNRLLWIANFFSDDVWGVDLASDTVESRIKVDKGPMAVAVTRDGTTVYVANAFSGSVSVIDEATRAVVNTLWVGGYPQGLAVSEDGTRLYVLRRQDGAVIALDAASGEVVARAAVGGNLTALHAQASFIAVAKSDASLVVLDAGSLERRREISVPLEPMDIASGPDANSVYVLSRNGRAVTLCNLRTGDVAPQRLGEAEYLALGFAPRGRTLLAARTAPDRVDVWRTDDAGRLLAAPILAAAPQPEPERAPVSPQSGSRVVPDSTDMPPPAQFAGAPPGKHPGQIVSEDLEAGAEPGSVELAPAVEPADVPAVPDAHGTSEAPPASSTDAEDLATALAGEQEPESELTRVAPDSDVKAVAEGGEHTPFRALPNGEREGVVLQPSDTVAGASSMETSASTDATASVPPRGKAVPGPQTAPEGLLARVMEPLDRLRGVAAPEAPAGSAMGTGEGLVVLNVAARSLGLVNAKLNAVTTMVPLPDQPTDVVVSPDGRRIYVANRYRQSIVVLDRSRQTPPEEWRLDATPAALGLSGDGARLAVVLADTNQLAVLDAASGRELAQASTGDWPQAVAVDAQGRHAYVANQRGNSITVVDIPSGKVAATWPVGLGPVDVEVSPDGASVLTVCAIDDTLLVLEADTGSIAKTIVLGDRPQALTLSPDGRHAYVANFLGGSVTKVDLRADEVLATFGGLHQPGGLALDSDGQYLYVTNRYENLLTVLRLPDGQIVSKIPVGEGPTIVQRMAAVPGA